VGSPAVVSADGVCLNVRNEAGLAANSTACIASGTQVTLLSGSVSIDGYRWQRVSADKVTGWVADRYLRPGVATVPVPTPAPTPPPLSGTFVATPRFGPTGLALAVFGGGSVDQVEAAALAGGATGVWAQDGGGAYQLLIVHGPTFANAAFRTAFAEGFPGVTAMTLTR
jgi:hypothetical protein